MAAADQAASTWEKIPAPEASTKGNPFEHCSSGLVHILDLAQSQQITCQLLICLPL